MTKRLNVYEIKTQFSKYLELVEKGETVVVCKRNVPVAEIRPIVQKKKRVPQLGWAEGKVEVLPSFDEPLTAEELRLWEEGDRPETTSKKKPGKK